jgi:hypothetical protein
VEKKMKNSFDDQNSFRSVDRPTHAFGRKELYLLLLLFVGGFAIDYWFDHYAQQSWQSPTEQPTSLHSVKRSLLL